MMSPRLVSAALMNKLLGNLEDLRRTRTHIHTRKTVGMCTVVNSTHVHLKRRLHVDIFFDIVRFSF